jgi:hypothetical protein
MSAREETNLYEECQALYESFLVSAAAGHYGREYLGLLNATEKCDKFADFSLLRKKHHQHLDKLRETYADRQGGEDFYYVKTAIHYRSWTLKSFEKALNWSKWWHYQKFKFRQFLHDIIHR